MGEIERYRERVEAAWREVAALPRLGWGQPGPPDPKTGERWDRANVHAFSGTYGDYLLNKVSKVFPELYRDL